MKVLEKIKDGWTNLFTGLGINGRDKRTGASVSWRRLSEIELDELYAGDDTAARVVDIIPETAFQKGIEIKKTKTVDSDLGDDIHEYLETRGVFDKVVEAWKAARSHGGAGIFIAADDGRLLSEPLDVSKIKTVYNLVVLNAFELVRGDIQSDLTKPNFGLPENYRITPRTVMPQVKTELGSQNLSTVHWTRIIRFDGLNIPRRLFVMNNYWGDPVTTRLYNVLRNFNLAHESAGALMEDFNLGVTKLKELASILQTEGGEKRIKDRLEIMRLSRSIIGTMVIDAENESYENIGRPVTGMADLLDRVNQRLVAATGMPHTIILGNSPSGGLSGKGEGENMDWYDNVANQRKRYAKSRLGSLIDIMLMAKDSPTSGSVPKGFSWDFCPLWQMDEKDIAAMRKTVAETDEIYISNGVASPADIAKSRFGGDTYSTDTVLSEIPEDPDENEPEAPDMED